MINVSVIMPAYNAEAYINEAIESVISQTFKNWELLIIDDGSSDKTAEIANYYASIDKRIFYLYQENGKQGKARNLGIKNSKGEYIAFLDADDLWVKNKLELQVDYLSTNSEIALLFSQGYFRKGDVNLTFDTAVKKYWDINDLPAFIESNQIPILSVLVKKKALKDVGYFNEDIEIQNVEDYHLWFKLLLEGFKFASIEYRLFYYRIHKKQTTFKYDHTKLPENHMFKHLITYWSFNQNLFVVKKIKWLLFNKITHSATIELLKQIYKNEKHIFTIISLVEKIPSQKIRSKLIFKLCQ